MKKEKNRFRFYDGRDQCLAEGASKSARNGASLQCLAFNSIRTSEQFDDLCSTEW